ncbi:MAG: tetratricopeptide repeat protein [Cryomorphaceae bacterium]
MAKRKGYTPKKQPAQAEEPVVNVESQPTQAGNRALPYFLVFALGFLLYANTIPFDYALDDKLYITANEFTKQGIEGIDEIWTNDLMTGFFGAKKKLVEGGRYRPLALTTHALEWQFFGHLPQLSHFINVVLYGLVAVVLLMVLRSIFGWREERWWFSLPFLATLLFIAHPLHTEVTANIKSRDEIMSLLFALLSFKAVLDFMQSKDKKLLAYGGMWFLLSLFSKESAVTFLGVMPLTLIFFPKGDWKTSMMAIAPIVGVTLLYVVIRLAVFGDQGASLDVAEELMNKPYLQATSSERLASIFFTMGLYLKLLVWPHPLTHDYYPFHPFRTFDELAAGDNPYYDWSHPGALISLVAYALILGFGIYTLIRSIRGEKGSVIGFSFLLYFGTFILFSNLFFDIGAFMNERFLFIPSLGFALILAYLLTHVVEKRMGQTLATSILVIVMIGYTGKTIVRNYAWENDRALATADVGTSDGSAKVKMTMGSEMLDLAKETANPTEKQRYLKEGERYCLQSLKIYPSYFPPLDILGNLYFEMGNYEYSIHYFSQAIKVRKNDDRLLTNLEAVGNVATQKGEFALADKAYKLLTKYRKGSDLSRIYSSLGELHGKSMNDMVGAKRFLRNAIEADPSNAAAHQKIGIVYAMTGAADSALYNFNKSLELEPENARVLLNLGILYKQLGQQEKGESYLQQAIAIDPSVAGGAN